MPSRIVRVLSLIAGAGLLACVLVIAAAASPAGAISGGGGAGNSVLLARCARTVLGIGRPGATPVSGSADPQVISRLAIFRRTRSLTDALPAAAGLRAALAGADARTYDPSAAVRLLRIGAGVAVYAVPVTMSASTLPANCAGLPHFAGAGAFLAFQAQEQGSGPGACLISTRLEDRAPGPPLPGARPPRPTKTLGVAGMACKSDAVLSGYTGALGDPLLGLGTHLALIPDGVGTITYALNNGHQFPVPVIGNLARVPAAAVSLPPTPRALTAAQLGRALAAHLPTTVTETGTGTNPTTTLTRPVSLVADAVGSFSFLRGLLTGGSGVSTSSSSGAESVACRARTHRCVAVSVTTTCDSRGHCRMSRTIHRYRYVGAKPPAGTTGPNTLPTAPIVGRTNRFVVRPRKLTLVLSGTPHRVVVVLLSVSCSSRDAGGSGGGPPLRLAVPSRTPITLPGGARTFRACDVGALVTSTARSSVHVTVARG